MMVDNPLSLSIERRGQIIGCLTEGMSIRGTVRLTGAAKNTVTKLLVDLGAACAAHHDTALRNDQHQLRRAAEPHDADRDAPISPPAQVPRWTGHPGDGRESRRVPLDRPGHRQSARPSTGGAGGAKIDPPISN